MKFEKTYCSQCGGEFGPGDSGYSHCKDHRARASQDNDARQTVGGDRDKSEMTSKLAAPHPDKRYIAWKCGMCGEEFFYMRVNGNPPHDTACVNCGSDETELYEDEKPDSQFGVGA